MSKFLLPKLLVAALSVAAGVGLAAPAMAQSRPAEPKLRFNPAFAKNPPRVVSTFLGHVDPGQWGGRTLILEVDFEPADKRIGRQVLVDFGEGPVVLRDDGFDGDAAPGDKRHTAVFSLDLTSRDIRRADLLEQVFQGVDTVLDFDGRELVGSHPLIDDVEAMTSGLVWTGVATAASDPFKSLLIRDLSVVNDPTRTFNPCTSVGNPTGVWTFGHLMGQFCQASGTPSVSAFTTNWLNTWANSHTINGWNVPGRPHAASILANWPKLSSGDLDMTKAPFRLLAIVNRVDLRDSPTYGGGAGNAGEARFVYCLVHPTTCAPMQWTVIFEYQIRKSGCAAVKAWAQQWEALDTMAFGPAYNNALQAITNQFTLSGSDPTQLPNMSTLAQLRTNEIQTSSGVGALWELREFRLDATGNLAMVTVKQTPDSTLNETATIGQYVNGMPAVNLPWPAVPNKYPAITNHFMGGSSIIADAPSLPVTSPPGLNSAWFGPATGPDVITLANNDKRHKFSLNTCNGCHARETNTLFTHVSPRPANAVAAVSGFLNGPFSVPDPHPASSVTRTFDDLGLRLQDLTAVANNSCLDTIMFEKQFAVH